MEGSNSKSKENLSVVSKTLSAAQLEQIIYGNESFPKDKRFLLTSDGGVFKYFDPEDLIGIGQKKEDQFYPVVEVDGKIVALAKLGKDAYKVDTMFIGFISVDPTYRDSGYASKLIEELVKFTKAKGYALEKPGIYSPEGWQKLRTVIERTALKYSVKLVNRY